MTLTCLGHSFILHYLILYLIYSVKYLFNVFNKVFNAKITHAFCLDVGQTNKYKI